MNTVSSKHVRIRPRRRGAADLGVEQLDPRQLLTASAPQILLTPAILANLRQEATTNSPQWQAFQGGLEGNLDKVIGPDSYEGDQYPLISDYALAYQVLSGVPGEQAKADNYADKAIGIMESAMNDYPRIPTEAREFLARGDGSKASFTLFDSDFHPETLRVYLAPVTTDSVVRGAEPFTQDVVDDYSTFIKVSNTFDGNPDYVEGTDWQHNPDYSEKMIDWSLAGNEPAPGTTYYVTLSSSGNADVEDPSADYSVSGDTTSFAKAPRSDQAIFVEYVYGPSARNGFRLSYQQTSAGDGGFNSILQPDDDYGYPSRYLGKHVAMGLDWLWSYPGLDERKKDNAATLLTRWSDELRDHSFHNDLPGSNYEAGAYDSRVMTALALSGRAPAGARLVSEVLGYRDAFVKPLLTAPSGSVAGGFWGEGWNYGALASENILLAAQALATAGLTAVPEEQHWASDEVQTLISSQPTPTTVYDGGDGYSYPEPFPSHNLTAVLATMADDPESRNDANYILQDRPRADGDTGTDYLDLLDGSSTAAASFWSSAPLQHNATGQGLVTARADWSYDSTWLSFQLGNLIRNDTTEDVADHQTDTPGQLEIQRGGDALLLNAEAWASITAPDRRATFGNAVVLDDHGAGLQNYPFSPGEWYGHPGVFLTHYDATADYVYTAGDYTAAYSHSGLDGNDGSATKLTREVVYLRPDIVIVHDRAGTVDPSFTKQLQWQFLNAPVVSGNSFEETVGSSKLFGQTYSDRQLTTSVQEVNAPGTPPDQLVGSGAMFYQVATRNAAATPEVHYTTALETAPASTAAMDSSRAAQSDDGRLEGVQIGANLVLFSKDGSADSSSTIAYTVTGAGPIRHLLVGLNPSQLYHVTVNRVTADHTADDQGTISFTTGQGVNHAPSFSKGPDESTTENAGATTIRGWATSISPGPASEGGQKVDFIVTTDDPALFLVAPAIAADGTLTFTPSVNEFGTAHVTVKLHDDGGTANGGQDTSAPQTFAITAAHVNQPPSFTAGPDETALATAGAQTIVGWATNISAGPADESGQALTFQLFVDDPSLFSAGPAISADGTLRYTPAPGASGTTFVMVTLRDNGGTDNGGFDSSIIHSLAITILPADAHHLPVVSAVPLSTIQGARLNGTTVAQFTDPDGQAASSFSASIDYGDGTAPAAGTVLADGTGAYRVTLAAPHTFERAGTFDLKVTVTDPFGGTVAATGKAVVSAVHLSGTGPTGPTNAAALTYAGSAPAGFTIQVIASGASLLGGSAQLGQTIADASGHWSLTVPTMIANGTFAISAHAFSPGGDGVGSSDLGSIIIDTTAPRVASIALDPATGRLTITFLETGSGIANTTLLGDGAYSVAQIVGKAGNLKPVAITSVQPGGPNQVVLTLGGGKKLKNTNVLIKVGAASLADSAGNDLDGEFTGALPTGDGRPGGDFITEIDVKGKAASGPKVFSPPSKGKKVRRKSLAQPSGPLTRLSSCRR
jgi:hypothetical protein